MLSLKNKYEALLRKIKPIEYALICLPFLLFIFSNPHTIYLVDDYEIQHVYLLVTLGLLFILFLGVLYFIGARWRILYFSTLLCFSIFLIFVLGEPEKFSEICDRDEAIRIGIQAILNGNYPYYEETSLNNPISPLPFTFYFYLPIYLLTGGRTFYMSIIIIIAFCIGLFYNFMDTEKDYLVLPLISFIVFSDWFFLEIILNSDIMITMFTLCIVLFIIPNEVPEQKKILKYVSIIPKTPQKINKQIILFSIFFGCILAMRIYFWLIGAIVFLYLLKIYGLKRSFLLILLTFTVFLCWILPFLLYNPDYFIENILMGPNSLKFSEWRTYKETHPIGHHILDFLNVYLTFDNENAIYISVFIIICSILLGFLKLDNKFHLFIIISICYIILLFFIYQGTSYRYLRDYLSLAAIPFIISFLYSELKLKESILSVKEGKD